MSATIETTFTGYRQIVTKYRGSRCDVCGETIPAETTTLYNPLSRTLRHISCHFNHPSNVVEIWEADVTTTDDETGEQITTHQIIRITTKRRETGMPRGVRLIRHIADVDREATLADIRTRFGHIATVRGNYA